MTDRSVVEVAVVGGGPAGSVAAGLLARKGHSVALLNRTPQRHALAESLPPSCLRLFDRIGLASAIDDAGFMRSRGNTVWWGSDEPRLELFPHGETGLQVHRRDFDAILLRMAARIGVDVVRDAVVRRVDLAKTSLATIAYVRNGQSHTMRAQWVLDCSGRAGVVAGTVREPERGRETVALAGTWRRAGGWSISNPTHTFVESYTDGWAWSVPVANDLRFVTVMVDRTHTSLERGGELSTMYRAEVAKTRHVRELIAAAEQTEPFWACGASPYGASDYVIDNCLLVGDAASFIDPLSSYGVKKAIASAWVAAATVHTALKEPNMADAAMAFHAGREKDVYRRFRELTTQQYEFVATGTAHPFWTARSTGDPADVIAGGEPDIAALRDDPGVLEAFEAIRRAPRLDLEVTPCAARIRRPGIRVDEIVWEDRLSCPWAPEGIRYLRGVDVLVVADLVARHEQVPDLFETYNRTAVPVALPDMLGALSVMVAKGLLRFRDVSHSTPNGVMAPAASPD